MIAKNDSKEWIHTNRHIDDIGVELSESTERNVTQSIAAGNNEVGKTDTNTNLLPSISTSEIYIDNQRTQGRGHSHGTESLLGDVDGLKGIGNSRSEGNDGHAHQGGQTLHTLLRNEQKRKGPYVRLFNEFNPSTHDSGEEERADGNEQEGD